MTRFPTLSVRFSDLSTDWIHQTKGFIRSGIRTHAWRTRLRPERSALDRSAILTVFVIGTPPPSLDYLGIRYRGGSAAPPPLSREPKVVEGLPRRRLKGLTETILKTSLKLIFLKATCQVKVRSNVKTRCSHVWRRRIQLPLLKKSYRKNHFL